MRKLTFLWALPMVFLLLQQVNAQVLVADWDTQNPTNAYVWAGTLTQGVANPDATGLNTSAKVLQYDRPAASYQAFHVEFTPSKLILNPVFSMLVYSPVAGAKIRVDLHDENGTKIGEVASTVATANVWTEVTFDFAGSLLPSLNYKSFEIYPNYNDGTNAETYYFDDMTFKSGFDNSTDAVIAREKFPQTNYSGAVSGITTWTGKNGAITNDQIQINGWPGTTFGGTYSYPYPSQLGAVELGITNTVDQKDTLILSGVKVKGFSDYRILLSSGGYYNTSAPDVFVKANDGTWTQITYTNKNTVSKQVEQYDLPTGIQTADTLAVMLACHNSWDGQWIDDIGVLGTIVKVSSISVTEANNNTSVLSGSTLQFNHSASPANAFDNTATWSVVNGTGSATIDQTGLLTPVTAGTVIVKATANDGSGVTGETIITIYDPITSFTVASNNNATTLTAGETIQMTATVAPATAKQDVAWSIVNEPGVTTVSASISNTGLVTPAADGVVYAKATALDGSGKTDSLKITVSGMLPVSLVDILVDSAKIDINNGTLTLPVNVDPDNASDTTLTWSIVSNDADTATINESTGLITAIRNGSITVRAASAADTSKHDDAIVVITNQIVEPTAIAIQSKNSADSIKADDGTLELSVVTTPADAAKNVIWSILNDSLNLASISDLGLVTAMRNGVVSVQVSSTLVNLADTIDITIINQIVEPTALTVTGEGGATSIDVNDGTLQMLVGVTPIDADTTVTWSIAANDAGLAKISATGKLTAANNGVVTVIATSVSDTSITGEAEITLNNQIINPTTITVSGEGGSTSIDVKGGSLQMLSEVTPAGADSIITWSIAANDTTLATISTTGLLTAVNNGVVTVIATSISDTSITGEAEITITNQLTRPTAITVSGEGGATSIDVKDGTLQMLAEVTPTGADSTVTWSIASDDAAMATISTTGLLTAVSDGTVTVIATSNADAAVTGEAEITITNQVGINDHVAGNLSLYPNPVDQTLYIDYQKTINSVEIISANGQVMNVTSEFNRNNNIYVGNLKAGIFVIRAITGNNVYTGSFIKK